MPPPRSSDSPLLPRAPRVDLALRFAAPAIAAIAPGILAATHLVHASGAARDEATIRVVGLGGAGAFHALDALASAAFVALPIGTRSLRAGLASAVFAAACGAILFAIARAFLARCATAPRLGAIVAAVVSIASSCGVAYQMESGGPGGAVLGAVLAFAPLAALAILDAPALATFAAGMALTYEPWVGVAAVTGAAAFAAASERSPLRSLRARDVALHAAIALLGALPAVVLAIARGRTSVVDGLTPFAWAPLDEAGASPRGDIGALVTLAHDEIGWVGSLLAGAGAVIATLVPRARAFVGAIAGVGLAGAAGIAMGAPAGPTRYAASALVFVAAVLLLAAVAMQALVRAVAAARVPYAEASAAMIVLLELTFPALAVDASELRLAARSPAISRAWERDAMDGLAPRTMIFIDGSAASRHLVALRASGELRPDVALIPTTALAGPMARRAIANEPALSPFFRDMALQGSASEWSLTSLAAQRPVAFAFDPSWPRPLARHAVPADLLVAFRPEPRGAIERKHALDAFGATRDRIAASFANGADAELRGVTASLLRGRVATFAALGEHDGLLRAIEDLRVFAPDDPAAKTDADTSSRLVAAKPRARR